MSLKRPRRPTAPRPLLPPRFARDRITAHDARSLTARYQSPRKRLTVARSRGRGWRARRDTTRGVETFQCTLDALSSARAPGLDPADLVAAPPTYVRSLY